MFEELRKVWAGPILTKYPSVSSFFGLVFRRMMLCSRSKTFVSLIILSLHRWPVVNYHVHKSMATKSSIAQLKEQIATLTKQLSHFDSLQGRVAKLKKK